jgi:transcriptional regulator with XRE-family HTH domain
MADKRKYPQPVVEKEIEAGRFLMEKRKSKGYTQSEIAVYLSIDRANYSRKENGEVPFTAGEFLFLNQLIDSLPLKIKKRAIQSLIPRI